MFNFLECTSQCFTQVLQMMLWALNHDPFQTFAIYFFPYNSVAFIVIDPMNAVSELFLLFTLSFFLSFCDGLVMIHLPPENGSCEGLFLISQKHQAVIYHWSLPQISRPFYACRADQLTIFSEWTRTEWTVMFPLSLWWICFIFEVWAELPISHTLRVPLKLFPKSKCYTWKSTADLFISKYGKQLLLELSDYILASEKRPSLKMDVIPRRKVNT